MFGISGQHLRVNQWKQLTSFQAAKEAVRQAILLANFKRQEFVILGDRTAESTGRIKTKIGSKAKNWVNKTSVRASKTSNILTSTRHAGATIGMSAMSGKKVLNQLLRQQLVQYEYSSNTRVVYGNHAAKYAYAEQHKPFPTCGYTITNTGVRYFLGRIVRLRPLLS